MQYFAQKIFIFFMKKNENDAPGISGGTPEPPVKKKKNGLGARNEDYNCKNLRFLIDLFDALGLSPNSYARLTPNPTSTAVGLRYQLNRDDMKVSKAREIVNTLGYKLDIRFTEKEEQEKTGNDTGYIVTLPESIHRPIESKYKNLAFLDEFMKKRKLSKRGFADEIKMSPGAVFTWFTLDDIAISYLNVIKDIYNVNLEFKILPKES